MNAALAARRLLPSAPPAIAQRWRPGVFPSSFRPFASQPAPDDEIHIANITEADVASARDCCTDLIRKYDTPSYTLRPFVPSRAQSAYLSLRAFNVSLALIGDSTSAPVVGSMRLQFWRDAVDRALALAPPKEPVAILLSHAAGSLMAATSGRARLSKPWLMRVINEREQHLQNPPFPDMAALETYAEHTYSTLLYLTLSSLPLASVTADHLASHIGKAQGIAAVLRGLPLLAFPQPVPNNARSNANAQLASLMPSAQQGAVTLPLASMAAAGLREEDVLRRGPDAPGLRDAVFEVATRANDHLITAREMLRNLRAGRGAGHEFEHAAETEHQHVREAGAADTNAADAERAFGVLMPAVATQLWLDRLQKCDFDVFHASLRQGDWRLPWRAYWAYSRRMF